MNDSIQLSEFDESREQTLLLRLRLRPALGMIGCFTLYMFVLSITQFALSERPFGFAGQLAQVLGISIIYMSIVAVAWRYTNPILVTKEGLLFRSLFARKTYISWRTVTKTKYAGSFTPFVNFFCDGSMKRSARIHLSYFTDPTFTQFILENKVKLPIGLVEILSKSERKASEVNQKLPSTEDR